MLQHPLGILALLSTFSREHAGLPKFTKQPSLTGSVRTENSSRKAPGHGVTRTGRVTGAPGATRAAPRAIFFAQVEDLLPTGRIMPATTRAFSGAVVVTAPPDPSR